MRRQYTQVARAESRKRTREALLHAAVERFLADRWDQATIGAIAADAGVTKQTLLRHFGSKAGLFEQAMLRDYEQVRAQRFAVPRGDLGAAVDNLLDHYEAWSGDAVRIADAAADSDALTALRGTRPPTALRLGRARLRSLARRARRSRPVAAPEHADRDLRPEHLAPAVARSGPLAPGDASHPAGGHRAH